MANGTEFEQFTKAVAQQTQTKSFSEQVPYKHVTVLGGGPDGLLLAALCLSANTEVTLFSAYGRELDGLRHSGGITLQGAGPIGVYQLDQANSPSIQTSAELDNAVATADLLFLTGPIHKQRTYAMALADHIKDGQVLVLAPGRSLGAAEVAWLLRVGGADVDFTIVEIQTLPYWYNVSGTKFVLSDAGVSFAASLPSGREYVLEGLKPLLPNIQVLPSTIHSGFADGSGIVEVPALILGGEILGDGLPELVEGGVPLPENNTFRAMVGNGHEAVMRKMVKERHSVARSYGVRDLPDLNAWLDIHAGKHKGDGTRPVPLGDEARRLVRCATLGSLIPLVSAARAAGDKPVPVTRAVVDLASAILGADLYSAGRHLQNIGVNANEIEDARRHLDNIATGSY